MRPIERRRRKTPLGVNHVIVRIEDVTTDRHEPLGDMLLQNSKKVLLSNHPLHRDLLYYCTLRSLMEFFEGFSSLIVLLRLINALLWAFFLTESTPCHRWGTVMLVRAWRTRRVRTADRVPRCGHILSIVRKPSYSSETLFFRRVLLCVSLSSESVCFDII